MRKIKQQNDSFYESLSDITMATLGIFVIFFVINVIFVNKDTIEIAVENQKLKEKTMLVTSTLEKIQMEDLEKIKALISENDQKIKQFEAKIDEIDILVKSKQDQVESLEKQFKKKFKVDGATAKIIRELIRELKIKRKKIEEELAVVQLKKGPIRQEFSEWIAANTEDRPHILISVSDNDIYLINGYYSTKTYISNEDFYHILDGINRGNGFNIVLTNSKENKGFIETPEWLHTLVERAGFPRIINNTIPELKNYSSEKLEQTLASLETSVGNVEVESDPPRNTQVVVDSLEKAIALKTATKKIQDEKTDSKPNFKFIAYDTPPEPMTPIKPIYPKIAKQAGIEGQVLVRCFIDKEGKVKETIVIKGIPNTGLNESAVTALRKTKFRPAQQRENPVGVWITIPINFKIY